VLIAAGIAGLALLWPSSERARVVQPVTVPRAA